MIDATIRAIEPSQKMKTKPLGDPECSFKRQRPVLGQVLRQSCKLSNKDPAAARLLDVRIRQQNTP